MPTAVIVNSTGDSRWWSRTFYKEYLPALEQGDPRLEVFLPPFRGHRCATDGSVCCRDIVFQWMVRQASPELDGAACVELHVARCGHLDHEPVAACSHI